MLSLKSSFHRALFVTYRVAALNRSYGIACLEIYRELQCVEAL
jgi:hypothetical protein